MINFPENDEKLATSTGFKSFQEIQAGLAIADVPGLRHTEDTEQQQKETEAKSDIFESESPVLQKNDAHTSAESIKTPENFSVVVADETKEMSNLNQKSRKIESAIAESYGDGTYEGHSSKSIITILFSFTYTQNSNKQF